MQPEAIIKKTAKGEEAIGQRAHDLDRNLRYALILVDGKSSVNEIRAKGSGLPDLDQSLQQLAEQGFITTGDSGSAAAASGASDYAAAKQQLIGIAEELLGSDADKVIKKLKAAPDSREGILEVTSGCKKMVKLIIDEDKAEQLMTRCSNILDGL